VPDLHSETERHYLEELLCSLNTKEQLLEFLVKTFEDPVEHNGESNTALEGIRATLYSSKHIEAMIAVPYYLDLKVQPE
jgi:hypothetical protein